jgi:hypothetical protein
VINLRKVLFPFFLRRGYLYKRGKFGIGGTLDNTDIMNNSLLLEIEGGF